MVVSVALHMIRVFYHGAYNVAEEFELGSGCIALLSSPYS